TAIRPPNTTRGQTQTTKSLWMSYFPFPTRIGVDGMYVCGRCQAPLWLSRHLLGFGEAFRAGEFAQFVFSRPCLLVCVDRVPRLRESLRIVDCDPVFEHARSRESDAFFDCHRVAMRREAFNKRIWKQRDRVHQ